MEPRRSVPDPAAGSTGSARQPATLVYRAFLKAAQLVPAPIQRFARSGPLGRVMRFALDRVAPAGRYEVLSVRSGALAGALLEVDVRKQRDMIAGTYESGVQAVLAQHVGPGETAFDVGAHLGFFTLLLARLVGRDGEVVSVEPDPFMGPRLESNLRKNDAGNVTVVKAAVGTVARERRFSPGAGGGVGHLAQDGEIQVAGTTLDELAESFGPPTLVKVDVEGGEIEVLEGGSGLLANHKTVFVVEVHDEQVQSKAQKLLAEFDYDITMIEDDPSRRRHLVAVPGGKE